MCCRVTGNCTFTLCWQWTSNESYPFSCDLCGRASSCGLRWRWRCDGCAAVNRRAELSYRPTSAGWEKCKQEASRRKGELKDLLRRGCGEGQGTGRTGCQVAKLPSCQPQASCFGSQLDWDEGVVLAVEVLWGGTLSVTAGGRLAIKQKIYIKGVTGGDIGIKLWVFCVYVHFRNPKSAKFEIHRAKK